MHGNDRFGAWGNRRFHQIGVNAVGIWPNVHHHRESARKEHGAGGGDEGEIGNDDLVPRPDVQRGHDNFNRGRTVRHGHAVPRAVKGREGTLELQRFGSRSSPPHAAFQDVHERATFFVVVHRPFGERLVLRLPTSQ